MSKLGHSSGDETAVLSRPIQRGLSSVEQQPSRSMTYGGLSRNDLDEVKSSTFPNVTLSRRHTSADIQQTTVKTADKPSGSSSSEDEDEAKETKKIENKSSQKQVISSEGKRKKKGITANLSGTRYEVVQLMVEKLGFSITREDDLSAFLIWNDSFVASERIAELKPYQRVNHFPAMGEICRKDALARNMAKLARDLPYDFDFVPRTWILPTDYNILQQYGKELKRKRKHKTFIVKPSNGAMGNGISLYKNVEKIPQMESFIVQEYIDKPFLLDGYKCDLRIYVLVTSVDPLRIFLFNDGLVRMGTEKYSHPLEANLDLTYMHLTNYSVNKHNDKYEKTANVDQGSKRSIRFFNDFLRKSDIDVALLWRNITDVIIKTLLAAEPHLLHAYRMCRPSAAAGSNCVCFEILGFDIIVDRKLKPWLLEINRSPSFGTDEKLDWDIKSSVIQDALRLVNVRASDRRRNMAAEKAEAQRRLLKPVHRRSTFDPEISDAERRKAEVRKKQQNLKETLKRLRRDNEREDFENRNCGRYRRIFPPDDSFHKKKYANILTAAFNCLLSGGKNGMAREIEETYTNRVREEDILDLLQQYESEESSPDAKDKDASKSTSISGYRRSAYLSCPPSSRTIWRVNWAARNGSQAVKPRGPRPLQGLPSAGPRTLTDEEDETGRRSDHTPQRRSRQQQPKTLIRNERQKTKLVTSATTRQVPLMADLEHDENTNELTRRTLDALRDMRIKFPGKTDVEAEECLEGIHLNWRSHKPLVASYWLVKLDSVKRRKVIEIVRQNCRVLLQRVWRTADIESLHLHRLLNRVFNRLTWSHGQGLWSCMNSTGGVSQTGWETIFSRTAESVNQLELQCCRRAVELCCDCLLIVYQFATESKTIPLGGGEQQQQQQQTKPPISNYSISLPVR